MRRSIQPPSATASADASVESRLVFLISAPRSGSTLLMRILNATTHVFSRPEPHLLPPLAHLGFWDTVDRAPYDQLQAQDAVRAYVSALPGGDQDYWDACRAYLDVLYGRMLQTAPAGQRYFLDKTPANALVLPFLMKIYPKARYVVLTRHPGGIWSSYANSFFDGDYRAALAFNPVLSRYIPPIAAALRDPTVPTLHVSYSELVSSGEMCLRRLCDFLEIPFDPGALNYQRSAVAAGGLGDPIGVDRHTRPVTSSLSEWAGEFANTPLAYETAAAQLGGIAPEDLATWGTPVDTLWEAVRRADPYGYTPKKKRWDRWSLRRRALVWLRRDIGDRPHGRAVRKLRYFCDVLLRG